MTSTRRQILGSPFYQGVDERIAYTLSTTPWGGTPSSVSVVLKNAVGVDVSATYTTGSPSVSGNVITLPVIHSLVAGSWYRVEVKFTINGNVFEAWGELIGET